MKKLGFLAVLGASMILSSCMNDRTPMGVVIQAGHALKTHDEKLLLRSIDGPLLQSHLAGTDRDDLLTDLTRLNGLQTEEQVRDLGTRVENGVARTLKCVRVYNLEDSPECHSILPIFCQIEYGFGIFAECRKSAADAASDTRHQQCRVVHAARDDITGVILGFKQFKVACDQTAPWWQ
ncbi:MAG: hypothetical protein ACXWPM_07910 [Bdellovibrionota bacterium]